MPTTSEKRARQRANKLLKSKSVAEPAVLIDQAPEIIPPPSQSTERTPALSTSLPPHISINFETFIELADLEDIPQFFDAIASIQEGRNLKLLWDRAFEAGLNQGRSEEREFRDEMYLRGKAQGIKEAEAVEIDFYHHGTEKGRIEERNEWISAGHGLHCLSPVAILSDESTQTDLVPSATASCDVSSQTVLLPDPIPNTTLTTSPSPTSFNWADDAALLPSQISPSPPRDLSSLRSSKSNPFSSLQRRSKNRTGRTLQPRHRRSHFNFNSFHPPHHISFSPFQRHSHIKTYSHLNWESDPRLSDLSRSLKALGWIRAS